tara:strand:- start:290 stop:445 length:156 start_codon:yes stop_codon:yes gene_type:complete
VSDSQKAKQPKPKRLETFIDPDGFVAFRVVPDTEPKKPFRLMLKKFLTPEK